MALVGTLIASGLVVAAPVEVPPVSAAPGPMHAIVLPRLLGGSVTGVNEAGQMVGTRSDGQGGFVVFRATVAGAVVDLDQPAGVQYASPVALTESGIVVTSAATDSTYEVVVYPAGSTTGTVLPKGPFTSLSASRVNESGQVVGSGTLPNGDTHAFVYDGTDIVDLGGPTGGYSTAEAIDATGTVVTGRVTQSDGSSTIVQWTNGTRADLGNPGDGWIYLSIVGHDGTPVGSFSTAGRDSAFVVDGTQLVPHAPLVAGHGSTISSISTAGVAIGNDWDASARVRAVRWSSPGTPQDLGTLGGLEAYAGDIDSSGRIVGTSTLPATPLMSDNGTHGYVIEDGVMYDVNDFLPAGTVEVTTLYDVTDSGYMLGDSRAGQVLLVPGPAPAPMYDVIDLTPAALRSQALGLSANGDVLVATESSALRWRDGSATAIPGSFQTGAISSDGRVAGMRIANNAVRGYRWDGPSAPFVDLGGGVVPVAVNAVGDVVGSRQSGPRQHAIWFRNGVAVDANPLLPGAISSDARTINDAGYLSGVIEGDAGARGYLAHGDDLTVVQPAAGSYSMIADVNLSGVAVGTISTDEQENAAFRLVNGVVEVLDPPSSSQSEAIAINESGVIAGAAFDDQSGRYRPFIHDAQGFRFSTGLGGQFASVLDLSNTGVAVGYGSTPIGPTHPLTFDGTTTVDLTTVVDQGIAFELEVARAINDAGWILVSASKYHPTGALEHAVLLVPHGTTDFAAPTVSVTSPADGAIVTSGASLTASYSCADAVALASCTGSVADGAPLDTSTPGTHELVVTARDATGLTTTRVVRYTVGDPNPPTATITAPAENATLALLDQTAADYSCTDDVAIASCTAPVADGAPIAPTAPGAGTFTVTATDTGGNVTTASAHYTVSNALAPGLGLDGTFTSTGIPYSVADAPAPDGVTVAVPSNAGGPVTMTACGGFTVELTPGSQATLTCGSLQATVTSGQVTVTNPAGTVDMIVEAGGSGRLEANGTAVDLGGTPITVIGPLSALALSPSTATVGVNVAQAFTVRGLDPQGHDLGDLTSSATFTISGTGGSCTANSCRANSLGVRTVTATVGTVTGTATLDVRQRQTISFTAISSKTMLQSPVTAVATATSTLPVTFSTTTPTVCTAGGTNGATITLVAAGTCTVQADQAGNATWAPAVPVTRTFTVNRANQTITFTSPGNQTITASPITVSATANSGLPVTFTTTTPAVCTANGTNGSSITLLDAGTCSVRAEQAGDSRYNAATAVTRSFTVTKVTNTITFPAPGGRTLAQSPVTVSATASSGLPVQFSTTTPAVCTAGGALGEVITLLTVGTCTVRAEQPGDATYRAATPVSRNINVTKAAQTITFPTLSATLITASPVTVSATASSGLPVQFATTTPAVCTAGGTNGATITLLAAGTCTVRATQPGDAIWNAATAVNRSFTVTLPAPAVTAFTATPTVLASAGGAVQLNATVASAATCRFAVSPAVAGFPVTVPCTNGTAATTATLPANTTASSRTYSFTVSAIRSGAPTATSSPVTVRVASSSEAIVDLGVTGSSEHDPAFAGVPLTTTFVVTNAGPSAAPASALTAAVPGGTTFLSSTISTGGNCTANAGMVSCSLGTLAAGGSATVSIRVTPSSVGSPTIIAQTSSSGVDLATTNDRFELTTTVVESSIVYTDDQTSNLLRMDPFSGSTVIASQSGSKQEAVLSPDKRKVVYSRFDSASSTWQLWVVGIDGSDEHLLRDLGNSNLPRPSWSPDGTKVVFSTPVSGMFKAVVVDVTGPPNPRLLVADTAVGEMWPAFTADGSQILFRDTCARPGPGSCRYHLIAADGSGPLTSFDSYPIGQGVVVDPTNTWFYFADQQGTIRRGRLDGTASETVTTGLGWGMTYWSLSPTGTRIAYNAIVNNQPVVSIVDVDGQNPKQLTTPYNLAAPAGCYSPAWSRDESQVVMHCYAGGAIFIATASTSATSPTAASGIGGSFRSRNPEWWGSRPSS
ncbi:MAG: hypothetical protein U0Q03_21905 [Acidimicrobiales bacterium]